MPRAKLWTGLLLLLLVAGSLGLFIWGPGEQEDAEPLDKGRWRTRRPAPGERVLTKEEAEAAERLLALPYLQGSRAAPAFSNVTVYDADAAYDGLNLYNSGHAPEALLMDMQGKTIHKWRYSIDRIWPDARGPIQSTYWRRVHLFPDGSLLAIFEGIGLLKLDRDSNLQWAFRGRCHHQAFVGQDGRIHVLTRRARIIPRIDPDRPVLEDSIAVLDERGRLLDQFSLLESFENSRYRPLLDGMDRDGDLFHTNTLYVLDGRHAAKSGVFKKGNILISILKLDAVAVVDPEIRQVVWAVSGGVTGMWSRQHDPQLLDDGAMLLFDNLGRDGRSKVIEFDPFTLKKAWEYPGDLKSDLYSETCGSSRRLPNGNTLITESDNGRAFEVTPDGKIVWEFYNPHRAGEHRELIATLFEMQRIENGYWKGRAESESR